MPHMLAEEYLGYVVMDPDLPRTYATIANALSGIGSSPVTLVLTKAGDGIWTINTPLVFPANVIVLIPMGVFVTGSGNITFGAWPEVAAGPAFYIGTGTVTYPPANDATFDILQARALGLNTAPTTQLHLLGTAANPATMIVNQATVGAGDAGIFFQGAGSSRAFLGLANADAANHLRLNMLPAGSDFIINNGRVGIDVVSALAKLHIQGDATNPATIITEQRTAHAGDAGIFFATAGNTTRGFLGLAGSDTLDHVHLNLLGGSALIIGAGNVGIGLTPTTQLELSTGGAQKLTGTTWTNPSDERIKEVQRPYTDGLNVVTALKAYWVKFNGLAGTPTQTPEFVAPLAQEVQSVAPYMVGSYSAKLHPEDTHDTSILNFDGSPLVFTLANAIKEQQDQIVALQGQVATLTDRVTALEALTRRSAPAAGAAGTDQAEEMAPPEPRRRRK